jgi:hypothetical protein
MLATLKMKTVKLKNLALSVPVIGRVVSLNQCFLILDNFPVEDNSTRNFIGSLSANGLPTIYE